MTSASIETCLVEKNGLILEVTFNRPERGNSLTPVEHEFLDLVWTEFEGDESLRVAILGAAGDRIFCSGNDFRYASEHGSFAIPPTGLAGLTSRFDREKPIIAAVNGAAAGGGFEIAMACDLVVAAGHATFSLPEVKAGTYAGAGGLIRLPRQVGDKIAMEMILTGRKIPAERACALGLVNRVVDGASLMREARQLAAEIVGNSPLACAVSKRIVNETRDIPALRDAQRVSDRLGAQLIGSREFRQGVSAFLEKRRPDWTGEEK
ncbi:MAG: enoyl-CoA hydratase-related protein [Gammaproteobacteria bacterium]|nr:enoyl-CoA hydratase-related protein [Gammaproteobacteria bacterium]MDE0366393.1 enoyl-CoA hydratase-related protein [Gammaproteobacteria bacterium]